MMLSSDSQFLQEVRVGEGPIAVYRDSGEVVTADEARVRCDFEITQTKDGTIFLYLRSFSPGQLGRAGLPRQFSGSMIEGSQVYTDNFNMQDEVNDGPGGSTALFRLNEVTVVQVPDARLPVRMKFGITNFVFLGPDVEPAPNHGSPRVLRCNLKGTQGQKWFKISPIPGYKKAKRRLQLFRSIEVTSEVETEESDIEETRSLVDDLCYLLSVARGTKVQWVYFDKYAPHGECVARVHSARITKSYVRLPTIDTNDIAKVDMRAFLEGGHRAYLERRALLQLDRGAIDLYLDAKAEQDFLETRAAKLTISLEFLKSVVLNIQEVSGSRFVVSESAFNQLEKEIKKSISPVLEKGGLSPEQRKLIYGNLKALNNVPFEKLVRCLCHYLGLEMSERAIKLFVACRNKLVHEAEFYCIAATDSDRKNCQPLPDRWTEYTFLVSFLDRIMLRILDYDGPFIDWSSGRPVRREHVCTAPPSL